MSAHLLALKIATPYARAFFDFSVEKNIMHIL
jgi:F0F1-type ATP synthase delta subunit